MYTSTSAERRDIDATFKFIKPLPLFAHEKPFQIFANLPDDAADKRFSNLEWEEKRKRVQDLRGREGKFSLDENGFEVVRWEGTGKQGDDDDGDKSDRKKMDFGSREGIEGEGGWLKEVEGLVRERVEGADRIFLFDWRLRKSHKDIDDTYDLNDPMKILPPAEGVHVDQSTMAVIGRIERQMPEEARELLRSRRIRVLNIWRPINHPVQDMPLALCDGSTVLPSHLIETDHVRSSYIGSTMYLVDKPEHRWYYLSGQREDEVFLFKNFDSKDGVAKYTPHGSFKVEEGFEEGWKPRESIEVRALIFTK